MLSLIHICSVVDHGHNHGIAFVQPAENVVGAFGIRHNGSVFVKWPPVIQKTDFQYIHAGTDQAFKNIDDIAIAKLLSLIHICCIPYE